MHFSNNIAKILILCFFTSLILSQEFSILSSKKKSSLFMHFTGYSIFEEDNIIDSNNFFSFKINYKSKSSIGFWINILQDDSFENEINQLGFSYLLAAKKWALMLIIENSIAELNRISDSSNYIYSEKLGWILSFKNNNPIYLKYINSYDNISSKKNDFITIGSLVPINKFILGYGLTLKARDVLLLDLHDGIFEVSLGYKFSKNKK